MNKKIIQLILLSLVGTVLLNGCSSSSSQFSSTELKPTTISRSEGQLSVEMETLDSLIEYADNIVIGTVLSEEEFSDSSTYKYTFSVRKDIKGDIDGQEIDVYEDYGNLEVDKEYLLFLEYWESELYPNPVYTSIGHKEDSIILIEKDSLKGSDKILQEKKSLKEMIQYIENNSGIKVKKNKGFKIKNKPDNDLDLVNSSDYVLSLIPIEISKENKYVKTVKVQITNQFKGTLTEDIIYNLPSKVEIGKEYLVFMKEDEGLKLTTRHGSIVSKDDEARWNELLEILQ